MIEKFTKKLFSLIAIFLIVFSSLMQNPVGTQEFISKLTNGGQEVVGLTASGATLSTQVILNHHSRSTYTFNDGASTWEDQALKLVLNGIPVFCLEPFQYAGNGYTYHSSPLGSGVSLRTGAGTVTFSAARIQDMAKIAYYGYKSQKNDKNYIYTQWMIWEAVRGVNLSSISNPPAGTSLSDFRSFSNTVKAKIAAGTGGGGTSVNNYTTSWSGQSINVNQYKGKTLTLNDTNNIASNLGQPTSANTGGITWSKLNGNMWSASIPANLAAGTYRFNFSGSSTSTTTGEPIDPGSTLIWKHAGGGQTIGQLYANIEEGTTIENNYFGNIILTSATDYTPDQVQVKFNHLGEPLGGATFTVTQKYSNGTVAVNPYSVQSTSTGHVLFKSMTNAANATIEIRETAAPAGYDINPNTYTIKLDAQGNIITSTIPKITNQPSNGEIFIEKSKFDGTSTTVGSGFIFDLIDKSTNQVVKTMTTDANGKASSGQIKLGTYIIRERPTNGYKVLPDSEVTITTAARTITYKATNESTTRELQLVKYDKSTNKIIAYEGVTFDIINKATNAKVATIKTDANGIAKTDQLPFGAYIAKEVEAPYGYLLSDQPQDFVLEASSPARVVIRFDNVPQKGSLTVNKTGDSIVEWVQGADGVFKATISKKPIQGVVFNVKDSKGFNYGEITTNASGVAKLDNLPIDETYTITEVTAPSEFVKSNPVTVKISYAGQNVQVAQGTGNVHNNHKFTDVSIAKEFEEYVGTKYAKIGLFTAKESYGLPADSLVGLAEVTGNQTITISNLPIDGEFYFKELEVNNAYKLNTNKFPVSTAFGSNNNAKFTASAGKMLNELITTSLSIVKYERGSDKKIVVPGATYKLIRLSDNKEIGDYTTDANGKILVEGLRPDKYRWREVSSPQGYFLNETTYDVETKPGVTAPVLIETDNERIPTIGTTASYDNLGKLDNPTNTLTIIDEVSYTNLVPGVEYVMSGALMHQETDKQLLDSAGKPIVSSVKFTPTTRDGSVKVQFTIDRAAVQRMRGQHITVFEWLTSADNVALTEHTDINDPNQTVEVTDPKIVTDAAFVNGEKLYNPIANVDITDVITYNNVLPKSNYVLDTKLIQKSGEALIKNEKFNFASGDKRDGTTSVTMKGIDLTKLRGQELVFYQDLLFENDLMARHANLNDTRQTVRVTNPKITSSAKYSDGLKESNPAPGVEIIDVVSYSDLVPNKKYRLQSAIMDVATGQVVDLANGETRFEPKTASGTVEVKMPNLDLSKLGGKKLVIFETLFYVDEAGKEHTIAIHHDLLDKLQQVDVLNPQIKTSASYVDKLKESDPMTGIGITDIVSYSGLVVGKKYRLDAVLMDYETGKPVNIGTGTTSFTPTSKTGNVDVKFQDLDLTKLRGKNIVVFETLYYIDDKGNAAAVANHHDIRDELQRVKITNPDLKTTAFFEDGRKLHEAFEKVTIHDDVVYNDLIPGKEYTMKATLMDKSTSKPIVIDGEPVTISSKFVPKAKSGTHRMTFVINATSLVGKTTVAFEELYRDTQRVGFHTDINDVDQTVRFINPKIGTTATFDDGTKISEPVKSVLIHDDVQYEDLIPGKEYKMTGQLMNKETGEVLIQNGEPVVQTVSFTPKEASGVVRLTFEVDARALRGKKLVAFERLTREDKELAIHHDIEDKEQTVEFTDPEIGTKAYWYDNSKEYEPIKSVILKDMVGYKNLIPGHKYVMTGKIMVKDTNSPLKQDGEEVVTSVEFTPESKDGQIELSFDIQANKLYGKELVVFETLTYKDEWMADHKDIKDEGQTVRVTNPEVKTTAYFEDKGKVHNPNTKVKIYDDVEFKDLVPGKEYELEGTLMVKETNKPLLQNEKPVVVREKFTPTTKEGTYRMVFEIDASSVRGQELVVFETLYSHGQDIYVHADINDVSQTVKITNPEIGTTATFQDPVDDKKHEPLTLVKVYDSVEYKDLVPGKEYTINGKLMNKDDGTPVMNEAGPVESSVTFTPDTPNGFATVVFEVEARNLRGKSVVAFEKLYNNGDLMAVHEDLKDEGQTVDITDPKIKTTAYFEDGLKVHEALKEVVIYDAVQYSNLIPGKEYTMTGHLRKKSDGEPLLNSNGDIISTTVTFVPEEPVGSVTLEFKVSANALRGEKVVAFETLYYKGEDIAVHNDIEDEEQTVRFINPKIGTLAKFMDELKISDPLSKTPMYDDVKYEDLIPGRTYTLRGVLMDKSTGEPFVYVDSEGKESILESIEEFSPESESGTYRMTFDIKLEDLRDQLRSRELVVFEELFYKGEEIVNHKEIEDEGQTVEFTNPEIGTTAVFDDGSKLTDPMSKVIIHDDVQYKGLIPGKEYQMTGQLMSQSTGEVLVQNGEPVTQTVSFTPEKSDGVIRLTFEVDARELRGQTVVAFEELHREGDSLATHHDIEDEEQSVSFPDPKIGTSAVFNDGTKTSDPVKDVVVVDTVSYEGLIPGHEYTITGRLMSKSTGRALIINSQTIDSELTFTPESESGSVNLEFTFDATELKGQELVVFEVLTHGGELMASHEDIEDKGQTVEIINPEIGTTATFDGESAQVSEPLEEVTVYDLVEYTGLIPGKEYTMSGKLMDKETGKEFIRDGKVVESTVQFTPKEADGSVMIEFKIKAKDLANKSLVAFESLISKGQEIAIHHDIEDENQTVVFTGPEIGTSAQFENGTKLSNPAGEVKVIDTVSYKGLIPGHEYRIVGQMMAKSTGKPVGKSVEGIFTAESSEGYAKIEFVINTDDLAGQEIVAFEKLFLGKEEIANHEDINDIGQTVRITGPNIGTKATFDGKEEKYSDPLELVKVYDTVEYKDLIPGNKYQMRGQFMDKETGNPISRDGKVVESVLEFTPEKSSGSVVLEFEIPAKELAGKSIVAFEWLSYEGKEIAIHTNIEDEKQTVHFRNPKIGTYASFLDNTKEQEVSKQAVIVDRVTYEGLTPGKTYTLKGQMMTKVDQKSVSQAETTFTPTAESGEVKLEFTVDASAYADGTEIVAFEEVSFEGQILAEHKDINDEGQTVSFKVIPEIKPEEPKPEPKPEKKPEIINPAGQFLETPFGIVIAGLGILLVIGLVVWFVIDRKKRTSK